MRVRISFTVEIDPDAWASEYGIDREDVRRDVHTYVEGSVRALLDAYRPDAPCAPERGN
jgi:hypothetical protein